MVLIIIGFIIYNFVQAIRYHHHLAKDNRKFDKDLIQYLYIVYRYGGMYYVRKENKNGSILYSGDCSIFPKSCYFYDEAFVKYIDHLGINVKDYSYIGTATSNQKKKMIFYCFLVDLENDDNLDEFERISPESPRDARSFLSLPEPSGLWNRQEAGRSGPSACNTQP